MTQLQQIRLMNAATILYLKKIGKKIERNKIIEKILEDETCFFKLQASDAKSILEDIGVSKEKIDTVYSELTSKETYYHLQAIGKINNNDSEIKIKYENFNSNNLFNNKSIYKTKNNTNIISTQIKENIFSKLIKKIKNLFKIK